MSSSVTRSGIGGTNGTTLATRSSTLESMTRRAPLPLSIGAHVLQDRQQPGAAVGPWRKSMEGLERLHQCFLYEILRLGAIALEPHRVTKQPVDVRHRFGLKHEPATIRVGIGGHSVSTADVRDGRSTPSPAVTTATAGRARCPSGLAPTGHRRQQGLSCRRSTDRQSREDVTLFHVVPPAP